LCIAFLLLSGFLVLVFDIWFFRLTSCCISFSFCRVLVMDSDAVLLLGVFLVFELFPCYCSGCIHSTSWKSPMELDLNNLHMCNTATIQLQYNNFFLCCSCIALVRSPAIEVFYNLQKNLQATCSSCKNVYCSCIALVRTAAIQQNFVL